MICLKLCFLSLENSCLIRLIGICLLNCHVIKSNTGHELCIGQRWSLVTGWVVLVWVALACSNHCLENRILEFQTRVKLRTSKYHFRWLPVYSYNTRTLFTTDVEYNLTYSLFSYTCLLLIWICWNYDIIVCAIPFQFSSSLVLSF